MLQMFLIVGRFKGNMYDSQKKLGILNNTLLHSYTMNHDYGKIIFLKPVNRESGVSYKNILR